LLGIDYTKVSKYFKLICDDIFELNFKQPTLSKKEGKILCFLSFNYFDQYCNFSIGMNVVPKIREHFQFFFMEVNLGFGAKLYFKL
jgi:hypothetical protein